VAKVITLSLGVEKYVVSRVFHVLQKGFMVNARVGCSINEFLCHQQNLSPAYIAQKINTIFLDGQPVDDIDSAVIQDGCTVALSGAMPGLAGAVMRRGSAYASFRHSITYKKANNDSQRKPGMVRLKLFNIVMNDLGLEFLENGFFISPRDLTDILENQSHEFWQGCKEIKLNEKPVKTGLLKDGQLALQSDLVFFSVKILK
jgi:hypothetical protein